jgi:hypothetical protein
LADVVKAWKHLSLTIIDELVQTSGKAKSSHAKPIFIDADPQEEQDRKSVYTNMNLVIW